MIEFLQNPFVLSAFFAIVLASLAAGVTGSYVVVKRISYMGGGISHTVLGGIGISVYLSRVYALPFFSPLLGATLFAVFSALLIGKIHLRNREREDTIISALWAVGMAIGILFISITPGYVGELSNYLVGNLLWVTQEELTLLFFLDLIVLGICAWNHKRFLALCVDETQTYLQGVPVERLYLTLLVIIALTIVLLVQVVGIILAMVLLTIPPAIANMFSRKLSHIMILSALLCLLFGTAGLFLSYAFDWPVGSSISLTAGITYFVLFSSRKE
jgi:zinc transport system permease protein